jgi:flavin reductase (DIM6/NTAB) family NADH-FMN oxidoreductase RutF
MADFSELMGTLDYPMFIVTARVGERRGGCLIGFGSQVSIEPPRFLACLSVENRTFRLARTARHLAVHVVPASGPGPALAELFGGDTGDEVDKFTRCAWSEGPHGLPILDGCARWFSGAVVEHWPLGDHVGFVLAPEAVEVGDDGPALMFQRAKRIEPGHPA